LAIDAKTPAEIAVSVVAQMVQVKNARPKPA
jgi:xanthine/CO dehydrogenase XdhC/CoxF family maturation factor